MTATRELGRSGLHVRPLAFGGNVFGWSADEKASFALLDAFVDAGFNLVDTADVYSAWVPGNAGGESETLIGKWFARSGKRDKVVLATKVAKWAERPGLTPDNMNAAVEDSLRRLQTDYIDLRNFKLIASRSGDVRLDNRLVGAIVDAYGRWDAARPADARHTGRRS